ncbi:hypothetical protein ANN_23823 [Periplaneta americana]|uniref:Reverse transcriptase domain-containing protein n=1 Tax=Periplaneta americana TaxID=6978 RepID=A0ABQ8SNC6_PERAM|nr:hypothetical protein ANN_23823 [Periplaneta americana]
MSIRHGFGPRRVRVTMEYHDNGEGKRESSRKSPRAFFVHNTFLCTIRDRYPYQRSVYKPLDCAAMSGVYSTANIDAISCCSVTVRKGTRPVLAYGSEEWTLRKCDERRLTTAEMRFMRKNAGCSLLDHHRNVDILKELKIDSIVHYLQQYRLQWQTHVKRMDRSRWPRQILYYIRGRGRQQPRYLRNIWNCYQQTVEYVSRTINTYEGWHTKLNTLIGMTHPSLYRLLEQLQRDVADRDIEKLQAGDSPPTKKRKYTQLDSRIARIVQNYEEYKTQGNALTYLRDIDHNLSGNMQRICVPKRTADRVVSSGTSITSRECINRVELQADTHRPWSSALAEMCKGYAVLSRVHCPQGPDNISILLIQKIQDIVIPTIAHIFNSSLITSTFPKIWKQAFVLPLPKVKVPTDPNDYRPISILPAISKALERIVHRQITNYMNEHKLFDKYQSGFRAGHNTSTALLKVTEDIREAIDSNKVTILTLLDLSKAFNSVNFDLLTHKLRNLHLSETAVSWFESYLRKDNNVLYPGIEALPGLT